MSLRDLRVRGLLPARAIMGFTLIVPIGIVIAVSPAKRGPCGGFDWGLSPASRVRLPFAEGWTGGTAFNPQHLIIGRTLALAGMVCNCVPPMILPVHASIEKLDPALVEASHDLYGGRRVTPRRGRSSCSCAAPARRWSRSCGAGASSR